MLYYGKIIALKVFRYFHRFNAHHLMYIYIHMTESLSIYSGWLEG
jgi:hypothetical protein